MSVIENTGLFNDQSEPEVSNDVQLSCSESNETLLQLRNENWELKRETFKLVSQLQKIQKKVKVDGEGCENEENAEMQNNYEKTEKDVQDQCTKSQKLLTESLAKQQEITGLKDEIKSLRESVQKYEETSQNQLRRLQEMTQIKFILEDKNVELEQTNKRLEEDVSELLMSLQYERTRRYEDLSDQRRRMSRSQSQNSQDAFQGNNSQVAEGRSSQSTFWKQWKRLTISTRENQ